MTQRCTRRVWCDTGTAIADNNESLDDELVEPTDAESSDPIEDELVQLTDNESSNPMCDEFV